MAGYLIRSAIRDAYGNALEEVRLAANPGEHAAVAGRRFRWPVPRADGAAGGDGDHRPWP